MIIKAICGVLLTAVVGITSYAAPVPTVQAVPATVSGQPGTAVGWGISLAYTESADWVVLNDSFFTGSQIYGTYKDYVAGEFIVAGPPPESSTVNIPFSRSNSTGLGEFDINANVPGTSITGNIVVDYSIFSQDPNSPTFDPGSFVSSGQASAPVAINIVPEPETFGLMLVAIALAACGHREARRSRAE
ncbi:MAG: hypothetical protein JOY85_26410 [Acidobacteriaceae bacterium]|nr:hypothetical protein [Acidobacteriaceae bacterium]